MFPVFRVVINTNFFNFAIAFAHVFQKILVDIVIKVCEGHLLGRRCSNIVLVVLEFKGKKTATAYQTFITFSIKKFETTALSSPQKYECTFPLI